ncbi:MAG TPA: amidohydrolase family protein [Acidimicrobiales bacterium]|nr:amidohydrolase family protein [Acidimicrobiales bacterium]
MTKLTKSFPVFDCDAHINDPTKIWDYVPDSKKELVRNTYWRDDSNAVLNGTVRVLGGGSGEFPGYNPICIAGPQMNKKIMRRLNGMQLTPEQKAYLHHEGAVDPHARIREMDLMGIDQVLVIPTMVIMHLPFAQNVEGLDVFCQAYNNFLVDWCAEEPGRLFGAALLPVQDPARAAREVRRASELGHPVGLIRPIDANALYPNDDAPSMMAGGGPYDVLFRAFEETGMVLGMHTFPAPAYPHPLGVDYLASPGELFTRAGTDSQTFSFIHEMQVWLAQVLLTGFLDRYPKLRMAVFESNAEWLPYALSTCDRLFKLYTRERGTTSNRLPSEAFADQCVISFESDEVGVFRQWRQFENIGIWASDAYHHDGADSWSAIRNMTECGVSEDAQAKLLGANARRMYGIDGKLFITDEPPPIDRPDWFPQGPELEAWADLVAHPRENADKLAEIAAADEGSAIGVGGIRVGGQGASY